MSAILTIWNFFNLEYTYTKFWVISLYLPWEQFLTTPFSMRPAHPAASVLAMTQDGRQRLVSGLVQRPTAPMLAVVLTSSSPSPWASNSTTSSIASPSTSKAFSKPRGVHRRSPCSRRQTSASIRSHRRQLPTARQIMTIRR